MDFFCIFVVLNDQLKTIQKKNNMKEIDIFPEKINYLILSIVGAASHVLGFYLFIQEPSLFGPWTYYTMFGFLMNGILSIINFLYQLKLQLNEK